MVLSQARTQRPPDTYIQVDDYKGYSAVIENPYGVKEPLVPEDRRLGCMMHIRRRFYDALKLGDKRAGFAVEIIRKLYAIEREAKELGFGDRAQMRQHQSVPLLDQFDNWVDELLPSLGKTGKLEEAVRYASQQRIYTRRCFIDGRFPIDNGAVERGIRKPAVGRKNFLFTGSEDAARRLAGAYSLVQTCRALNIPTRDYLIDIIKKLEAGWPMRRLTDLLPHNWSPAL